MESKKYTLEQEQIARFAKAMGHPARMAILEFLAKQDCCFFLHDQISPISLYSPLPVISDSLCRRLQISWVSGYVHCRPSRSASR